MKIGGAANPMSKTYGLKNRDPFWHAPIYIHVTQIKPFYTHLKKLYAFLIFSILYIFSHCKYQTLVTTKLTKFRVSTVIDILLSIVNSSFIPYK